MRLEPSDIADFEPLIAEVVAQTIAKLQPEQSPTVDDGRLCYSEAEAAEKLGVEIHVLREQRKLGRLSFSRIGRRIMYSKEDLKTYLDSSRVVADGA